jgi:hypothetical protein
MDGGAAICIDRERDFNTTDLQDGSCLIPARISATSLSRRKGTFSIAEIENQSRIGANVCCRLVTEVCDRG